MARSNSPWPQEVAEDAADPNIHDVYQDIRNVLDLPNVNLLYRRLAVEPPALAWAWGLVRGPALAGLLDQGASDLAKALAAHPLPDLPDPALHVLGIDRKARAEIMKVLATFNSANPRNLIGACLWQAALAGASRRMPAPIDIRKRRGAAPASNYQLPPIIQIDQMDADTAGIVMGLLKWRDPKMTATVPSLFRHLAHWPQFLAIALATIGPLHATGWVADTQKALLTNAKRLAENILSKGTEDFPPPSDTAARQAISEIANTYPEKISEMVVVGHVLAASLAQS